jgi:hypothetical protein
MPVQQEAVDDPLIKMWDRDNDPIIAAIVELRQQVTELDTKHRMVTVQLAEVHRLLVRVLLSQREP